MDLLHLLRRQNNGPPRFLALGASLLEGMSTSVVAVLSSLVGATVVSGVGYYNVVPSGIDYDFCTGVLPSGITFSRASSGTFLASSGLVSSSAIHSPRFDYDPISLSVLGILIEPSSTNYQNASVINSSYMDVNVVTTYNNSMAPDGTLTAALVTDNATNSYHHIYKGADTSYASGVTYTASFFAKRGTATVVQFCYRYTLFGYEAYANFDLVNKTVVAGTSVIASITDLGGDWFLCRCTATATASGSTTYNRIGLTNNNANAVYLPTYTGSGQSLHIWGFAIEVGMGTSYIPTSGTTVTRSVDVLSFTVPEGVTTLRYTFDNNSTQDVSVSSGSYTVPSNLNRSRIKRIQSV